MSVRGPMSSRASYWGKKDQFLWLRAENLWVMHVSSGVQCDHCVTYQGAFLESGGGTVMGILVVS